MANQPGIQLWNISSRAVNESDVTIWPTFNLFCTRRADPSVADGSTDRHNAGRLRFAQHVSGRHEYPRRNAKSCAEEIWTSRLIRLCSHGHDRENSSSYVNEGRWLC